MEIRLIRHGKPQFWENYEPYTLMSGDGITAALTEYDKSGVLPTSRPTKLSIEAAEGVDVAFCSGLKRAVETASLLGVSAKLIEDPLFAEPEVPHGFWKKAKLPLAIWIGISRVIWALGYTLNCESIKKARARAEKAANVLITAANQNGTVLLVGHSLMNNMIFRSLRRHKWKASRLFNGKFWGCNVLRR
ncbi:MAG: histidine phosphatase family protein [Chitinispirillia bacterium]|nr:histidine phosphatase family protein [Chitinispirillia bacterium]MCL2267636.1 histidine phosphatase family protein [Chitinispirillia bacterium]